MAGTSIRIALASGAIAALVATGTFAQNQQVYRYVALFSVLCFLFMTHMPQLPLLAVMAFFPFFMMSVSGRNIPLQALMTTIPEPASRGAFLSVNAALQQLGSGLGALLGGLTLQTDSAGHIAGYGINGWIAAGITLLTVTWIGQVSSAGQASVRPAV